MKCNRTQNRSIIPGNIPNRIFYNVVLSTNTPNERAKKKERQRNELMMIFFLVGGLFYTETICFILNNNIICMRDFLFCYLSFCHGSILSSVYVVCENLQNETETIWKFFGGIARYRKFTAAPQKNETHWTVTTTECILCFIVTIIIIISSGSILKCNICTNTWLLLKFCASFSLIL